MNLNLNLNKFNRWAWYIAFITMALTLSPFAFQFENIGSYTWVIHPGDFVVNCFLLFPLGYIFVEYLGSSFSYKKLYAAILVGGLISIAIESSQLLLEQRTSQYWDVIANTFSFMLGSVCNRFIKFNSIREKVKSKFGEKKSPLFSLLGLIFILILFRLRLINEGLDDLLYLVLLMTSAVIISILFYDIDSDKQKNSTQAFLMFLGFAISSSIFHLSLSVQHFVSILLFVGIFTFSITFWMPENKPSLTKAFSKFMMIILLGILSLFLMYAIGFVLQSELNFSLLPNDKLHSLKEGRLVGSVFVEFFLLLCLCVELLSFILYAAQSRLKYVLCCSAYFLLGSGYIFFNNSVVQGTGFVFSFLAITPIIIWLNLPTKTRASAIL
tara:strand:+ start:8682 stop:9830 length:1149 start_codon:yes stop_codon:yes gene_type:complete